ncbi:MAG: PspA/IM30 family protein [Acidobacteriota bacterium]
MALLERVSTLLRANLNDLIDKAEDPEKMLKQLVLDMENQMMQVKTQVAIALADEHLLEKKRTEHEDAEKEWHRKAELAVRKNDEGLARVALERSLSARNMAAGFRQQLEDQKTEVDTLKTALRSLEQKLAETRSRCELMIAESRRARVVGRAQKARETIARKEGDVSIARMKSRIAGAEAQNAASRELLDGDGVEEKFAKLEREEQIDALLRDLKEQHAKTA